MDLALREGGDADLARTLVGGVPTEQRLVDPRGPAGAEVHGDAEEKARAHANLLRDRQAAVPGEREAERGTVAVVLDCGEDVAEREVLGQLVEEREAGARAAAKSHFWHVTGLDNLSSLATRDGLYTPPLLRETAPPVMSHPLSL